MRNGVELASDEMAEGDEASQAGNLDKNYMKFQVKENVCLKGHLDRARERPCPLAGVEKLRPRTRSSAPLPPFSQGPATHPRLTLLLLAAHTTRLSCLVRCSARRGRVLLQAFDLRGPSKLSPLACTLWSSSLVHVQAPLDPSQPSSFPLSFSSPLAAFRRGRPFGPSDDHLLFLCSSHDTLALSLQPQPQPDTLFTSSQLVSTSPPLLTTGSTSFVLSSSYARPLAALHASLPTSNDLSAFLPQVARSNPFSFPLPAHHLSFGQRTHRTRLARQDKQQPDASCLLETVRPSSLSCHCEWRRELTGKPWVRRWLGAALAEPTRLVSSTRLVPSLQAFFAC